MTLQSFSAQSGWKNVILSRCATTLYPGVLCALLSQNLVKVEIAHRDIHLIFRHYHLLLNHDLTVIQRTEWLEKSRKNAILSRCATTPHD